MGFLSLLWQSFFIFYIFTFLVFAPAFARSDGLLPASVAWAWTAARKGSEPDEGVVVDVGSGSPSGSSASSA